MNARLVDGISVAGPVRLWRAALSAVRPRVVVVVAVLLLFRILSTNVEELLDVIRTHRIEDWSLRCLLSYRSLLLGTLPMLIGISVATAVGPPRGPKRIALLAITIILSTGVGLLLRFGFRVGGGRNDLWGAIAYLWPLYALLGGMLTVAWDFYRRELASIETLQQVELDRLVLEREMAEARLRVMQAQIEPHFLFNTLANVRRLYDTDRRAGRTMLENLMRYLEVALPRMRETQSTLGRDVELAEAFLLIQQIRMGERLSFAIDIPGPLRAQAIPPMMLLTLVENAIKHGLDPSPAGGRMRISARREDNRLILRVADSGVGFGTGSGTGTGLANVRARLATLHGASASLVLEHNDFGGVTATITLPLHPGAEEQ